jgi:sugar lactone lactonase YvrE
MNFRSKRSIDKSVSLFLAFIAILFAVKTATADMIVTVAGGGPAYIGDGGAATLSQFYSPRSVAIDSLGNIYIADAEHYRIRKVDTSGIISTVAGNGTSGYSGDGGPATAAELNLPVGVAVDLTGNIYIAEYSGRIRKVNTSGIISTFAGGGSSGLGDGGPAIAAQLSCSSDVAVDTAGNVYIADMGNSRVRKVDTSGIITTIAGTGSQGSSGDGGLATEARLTWPVGVAVDPSGNIYIADDAEDRIRKVDTYGIITTFAGTGTSGYSGDGGYATAAQINLPHDVTVDSSGNVYIADCYNNRIRRVDTSGVITTFAGDGTSGYSGDGGPATSAKIYMPWGVAVDNSGNILIADEGNSRIRKVYAQPVPGAPTDVLASGGNSRAIVSFTAPTSQGGGPITSYTVSSIPGGIAATGAGSPITVTGLTNGAGYSFVVRAVNSFGTGPFSDPSNSVIPEQLQIRTIAGNGSGGYSGDGVAAILAQLYNPTGVAVDSSGNIYIADNYNNRIRKVDTIGVISTFAGDGTNGYAGDGGPATSAKLSRPNGVTTDSAGNIYIADKENNRVRKVDTTGVISTVAGNGTVGFSGDGGLAIEAKLYYPTGVAIDPSGNIYIADYYNNRIRKVDTTGGISTVAGNGSSGYSGDGGPATSASLYNPSGVAIDRLGNIYIADTSNNRIRRVDSSGVISTVAGDGTNGYSGDGGPAISAKLRSPQGVAVDMLGNLYIADSSNYRIRKVGTSGVINTIAGDGTYGYAGDGSAAIAAEFRYPVAIAVDRSGDLFIADAYNHRIREAFIAYTASAFNLSVNISGNGTVTNIDPTGPTFACNSSSCTSTFNAGSVFTLHATPNDGRSFDMWTSSVCGASGDCVFILSENTTVSATFIVNPLVQVAGFADPFGTIQEAYAAAVEGSLANCVLKAQAVTFNGPFNFGGHMNATLKGGFNQAFSSNIDCFSYLQGILTILDGSLAIENLVIK